MSQNVYSVIHSVCLLYLLSYFTMLPSLSQQKLSSLVKKHDTQHIMLLSN